MGPLAEGGYAVAASLGCCLELRQGSRSANLRDPVVRLAYIVALVALLGQATGGLLSPSGLRTPEQAFTAGRTPPNQPLEDLYALYHDTRVDREQSPERRAGRTYANERLYKVLNDATEKINKLNVELSGRKYQGSRVVDGAPPTPERKRQIQELKLEIARKALKASEAKK